MRHIVAHLYGVVCGDGEEVAAIVEASRESSAAGFVFLDFDRTLCTTKTGNSPLHGKHALDPELLGIACSHPNVHVVRLGRRETRENMKKPRIVLLVISLGDSSSPRLP